MNWSAHCLHSLCSVDAAGEMDSYVAESLAQVYVHNVILQDQQVGVCSVDNHHGVR